MCFWVCPAINKLILFVSVLRLRRNTHWQQNDSFDSLLSRAGLGHLGKGWLVRGTPTTYVEDCLTGLTGSSTRVEIEIVILIFFFCESEMLFCSAFWTHLDALARTITKRFCYSMHNPLDVERCFSLLNFDHNPFTQTSIIASTALSFWRAAGNAMQCNRVRESVRKTKNFSLQSRTNVGPNKIVI